MDLGKKKENFSSKSIPLLFSFSFITMEITF
jgi:hypothetical protein